MATDPETKTRENRLRRKASLYGLRLSKSPRRDPDALDYSLYALFDDQTNFPINPALIGRFVYSWNLDAVEAYLISDGDEPAPARKAMKTAARVPVPERLEDLAGPPPSLQKAYRLAAQGRTIPRPPSRIEEIGEGTFKVAYEEMGGIKLAAKPKPKSSSRRPR